MLVVDDDRAHVERLENLLRATGTFGVLHTAADVSLAIERIREREPDLVFLETNMMRESGLSLLKLVTTATTAEVVVISANPQHAVEAFDAGALDYVLKPVNSERLQRAIGRYMNGHRNGLPRPNNTALSLVDEETTLLGSTEGADRFVIRSSGRIYAVAYTDVDWIESSGNYVRLHGGGRVHIYRATLTELENCLPQGSFKRIHRSTLVNVQRVREMRVIGRGASAVVLVDGTELPVSRRNRASVQALLRG